MAVRALMIRLMTSPFSCLSVEITVMMRPRSLRPTVTSRSSPTECQMSGLVKAKKSPKTVAASPNVTPCF